MVKAATQAAQLPGKIVFDVDPERVKAGDPYKIRIYLLNEGSAPIEVQSMVIATSINGKSVRGAVPPLSKEIAPRQRALLRELPDTWKEATTSWSMEVTVRTPRSETYTQPGDLAVRWMRPLLALLASSGPALADPPSVDHQPVPCTVGGQPFTVCATVTDDGEVARARVYFKPENAKFYSFVDMAFGGIEFCGTLPAPREGKLKTIEYYVQAVDDDVRELPHQHARDRPPAGRRLRLRAGREGPVAHAVDHGARHPPEAGPEASRRFRERRCHVCPCPRPLASCCWRCPPPRRMPPCGWR